MLNIRNVLTHLTIDDESPSGAVQDIRASANAAANPRQYVTDAMVMLFGKDTKLIGHIPARIALQYAVNDAVANGCDISDVDLLLAHAEEKAIAFVNNPANQYHWKAESAESLRLEGDLVTGGQVVQQQAAVLRDDGKPKRGSKQVRARELYLQHVINAETPMSNGDFINLLMRDPLTQMSKSGATTYRYNLAKEFGAKNNS